MALNDVTVDYAGTYPGASMVAPTTTESVVAPDLRTSLLVSIGGTATTITITNPGTDNLGRAKTNFVIGPLTSTIRQIKIGRDYRDPVTGNVTIAFSQVTGVTACIVRSPA